MDIGEVLTALGPFPGLHLSVRRLAFERDQLRAALPRHADEGTIPVDPDVIRCLLKFGGPVTEAQRVPWLIARNNARGVLARHGISVDE